MTANYFNIKEQSKNQIGNRTTAFTNWCRSHVRNVQSEKNGGVYLSPVSAPGWYLLPLSNAAFILCHQNLFKKRGTKPHR